MNDTTAPLVFTTSRPFLAIGTSGACLGWLSLIANIVDNTVSVINTVTQKVISNIKVDKGPNGITFSGVMFQ